MAHCNLHLDWKLLEILRNKRLVHGPLYFTPGMEALKIMRNKKLMNAHCNLQLEWRF